jgi:hypothetical protein
MRVTAIVAMAFLFFQTFSPLLASSSGVPVRQEKASEKSGNVGLKFLVGAAVIASILSYMMKTTKPHQKRMKKGGSSNPVSRSPKKSTRLTHAPFLNDGASAALIMPLFANGNNALPMQATSRPPSPVTDLRNAIEGRCIKTILNTAENIKSEDWPSIPKDLLEKLLKWLKENESRRSRRIIKQIEDAIRLAQ